VRIVLDDQDVPGAVHGPILGRSGGGVITLC
jgi:hypothetical protein